MTAVRVGHANERRSTNRKIALAAVAAGIPILPVTDDKRPLVPAFQRLDTSLSAEDRAEYEAKAQAGGKPAPAHVGSTLDPATVRRLFKAFPDALPAACGGPAGLVVIDVDAKRDGVSKVERWLADNGHVLPVGTPVTHTQSGGRHYIFRDVEGHGNKAGALGVLGCDVRGSGGVFVLPGAVRANGARYRDGGAVKLAAAYATGKIPLLPEYFEKAIRQGGSGPAAITDDAMAALAERLRTTEPPEALDAAEYVSEEGASRSQFRLSLANRMCARGECVECYLATLLEAEHAGTFVGDDVPKEGEFNFRNVARDWLSAEALLADEAVAAERIAAISAEAFGDVSDSSIAACQAIIAAFERGDDPSPEIERGRLALESADDVTVHLATAFREFDDAVALDAGISTALTRLKAAMGRSTGKTAPSDHEPAHYLEAKAAKASKNSALAWEDQHASAELMRTHRAEPLVADVLECGAISVVYGNSNAGKSFVVAGLGYAVASGLPWHLYATTKGAVVYIGLEGRSGFRRRVAALRSEMAPHAPEPAIFATTQVEGVNLTAEGSDATRIVATIGEVETAGGHPVRLVVIDTLAAVIAGSDENSGRDMGAFVREIKKIAAAYPRVHILIVHHTGKDQARGARGHSSLRAAVDTEMEVSPGEIRVTKQRDLHFVPSIGFRLEPVCLGEDDAGRPLRTAIARLHSIRGASTGEAFGAAEDDDVDFVRGTLLPDQRSVFDAAVKAIDAANGEPVAPASIVAELAKMCSTLKPNTIRKTITRKLISCGLLERVGDNYRLSTRLHTAKSDG